MAAVAELRRRLPLGDEVAAIAVVGTNGKTSTATYLSRLLTAAGARVGLYTSPHLSDWTERVRIAGAECEPELLLAALEEVHEAALAGADLSRLRFFDALTLAGELIFARAGVSAAICEAGIGGRLDAVRLLRPRLTLLTDVGLDHVEILGHDPATILREKLLVAPPGGTVLIGSLAAELGQRAEEIAAANGLDLRRLEPGPVPAAGAENLAGPLRQALDLALGGRRLAAELLGVGGGEEAGVELEVPGRYESGERDRVRYLLDSAHNAPGWARLGEELARSAGGPVVAVVSLSPDKPGGELAAVLAAVPGLLEVVVTRHPRLPAADPEAIAALLAARGLRTSVSAEPAAALELAFGKARGSGAMVAVFGSTHLVGAARSLLAGRRAPAQL